MIVPVLYTTLDARSTNPIQEIGSREVSGQPENTQGREGQKEERWCHSVPRFHPGPGGEYLSVRLLHSDTSPSRICVGTGGWTDWGDEVRRLLRVNNQSLRDKTNVTEQTHKGSRTRTKITCSTKIVQKTVQFDYCRVFVVYFFFLNNDMSERYPIVLEGVHRGLEKKSVSQSNTRRLECTI